MRNVLIVDDHLVTAEGVARFIDDHESLRVVAVCNSTRAALAATEVLPEPVHVCVVDLYIPDEQTGQAIRDLRERVPGAKMICLTAGEGLYDEKLAREMGAHAVVHKSVSPRLVLEECLREHSDDTGLLKDVTSEKPKFTSRQSDIIKQLSQGKSDKEIAAALQISPETVRTHIRHLFEMTKTNSRQKLTNWIRANGYIY